MAVGLARAAAVACVVAFGATCVGGVPAVAQTTNVLTAVQFSASLSAEQRVAAVKDRIAALVNAVRSGQVTANQARDAIRNLIATNPAVAGDVVKAIITVSKEGVPGLPPNLSLTQLLADGVALGVRELQVVAATNPSAQAALQSVNQVFVDEGVSRGSAFGAQFAVTLNAAGGALLPPQLAPETSPIAVIIPSLPNDTTNEISPT
ncbi:hypothetical protein AncyloWKF20_07340 [Ancylobacter sp. WKF20]|uniref:hypothetical protein n=1 Tax=Ancylobacter sp. WKF20 TaxID=3039801 RepID=UPI0024343845|nr:hypothetical protein [Ancylobacter sp. WKF20]WGD31627.1 hypothetical protein AncyloWKF20_07340 [Ancylobacter sp. WKF20]